MILHRYVFRELVQAFVMAFVIVSSLALLAVLFKVMRGYGDLGLAFVLETLPMAVGYVAPWALMVAACTAPTLVYGRLTADNEIDAMRLSGIPFWKIVLPAVLFGVVLSGLGWILVEQVAPAAHFHNRTAMRKSIKILLDNPPTGKQELKFDNVRLLYLDFKDKRFVSPVIIHHGGRGMNWIAAEYKADSGYAVVEEGSPPMIVLTRPTIERFHPDGTVDRFTAEGDFPVEIPVEGGVTTKGPADMSLRELRRAAKEKVHAKDRGEIRTLYHSRFARSVAPLLIVLVSVPIGIFVRKGSRLAGLGAAVPPLLVYFVAFLVFRGMGEKGEAAPWLAAWAPDLILAIAAAALLGRAMGR